MKEILLFGPPGPLLGCLHIHLNTPVGRGLSAAIEWDPKCSGGNRPVLADLYRVMCDIYIVLYLGKVVLCFLQGGHKLRFTAQKMFFEIEITAPTIFIKLSESLDGDQ